MNVEPLLETPLQSVVNVPGDNANGEGIGSPVFPSATAAQGTANRESLDPRTGESGTGDSEPDGSVLVAFVNEFDLMGRRVQFEVDHDTGDLNIQIVDRNSGEVVRQIPPEQLTRFSRRFQEVLGLLIDEQA